MLYVDLRLQRLSPDPLPWSICLLIQEWLSCTFGNKANVWPLYGGRGADFIFYCLRKCSHEDIPQSAVHWQRFGKHIS